MRLVPPRCPTCGAPPTGILETIQGVAHLDVGKDDAEYAGGTEVLWDTQTPVRDDAHRVTLVGECDHLWQAELIEPPDE
ncbi:MAG: hypothetical protein RIC55_20560 [Pirellulaceae bacterium]